MNIEFPDKETIAEFFFNEKKPFLPKLPEGMDWVEYIDLAMQAIKIAIEELPLDDYKPIEEFLGYDPAYQADPSLLQQLNVPSVMLTSDEEGVPLLYLRIFTKEGSWLGEATCNLIGTSGYFAGRAFALVTQLKQAGLVMTDEYVRDFIIRRTADMLVTAFRKLKDRIEITVSSFIDEVYLDCEEFWYEYHAEFNSLKGYKMKRFTYARAKENLLKKHEEQIRTLWADDSLERLLDNKKQLLALYYEKTYEHWKEMDRLQREGKNWRRYINAGDMADVTDDLIEAFEKDANISGLAIEHAARRAELYNIFDVKETRLERRKSGILDSGYSRSRLFELKSEGEKLLERRRTSQSTPE